MHYLHCVLAKTTRDEPKFQEIKKPSTRTLLHSFLWYVRYSPLETLDVDLRLSIRFSLASFRFILSSSSIRVSRLSVTLHSSFTAPTFSMKILSWNTRNDKYEVTNCNEISHINTGLAFWSDFRLLDCLVQLIGLHCDNKQLTKKVNENKICCSLKCYFHWFYKRYWSQQNFHKNKVKLSLYSSSTGMLSE